ncbi:MAG: hypothetical protein ACOYMW_16000 [Candidatus Competibacteraceae bacterium]
MARRPRQKIRKTPEFDVIEIKWLTGFPYEGQHPALDNHSFCLYAVHGIRYTQQTPRLQYIGQTIQTVRQRFNDQNHKVHRVNRQRTVLWESQEINYI